MLGNGEGEGRKGAHLCSPHNMKELSTAVNTPPGKHSSGQEVGVAV